MVNFACSFASNFFAFSVSSAFDELILRSVMFARFVLISCLWHSSISTGEEDALCDFYFDRQNRFKESSSFFLRCQVASTFWWLRLVGKSSPFAVSIVIPWIAHANDLFVRWLVILCAFGTLARSPSDCWAHQSRCDQLGSPKNCGVHLSVLIGKSLIYLHRRQLTGICVCRWHRV